MSYPGGKGGAGVAQTIINLMPPHRVYIEPFLGGASVMRAKRPAALNIGLDLELAALEAAMLAVRAECDVNPRACAETAMPPAGSPGTSVPAEIVECGDKRSRIGGSGERRRRNALKMPMPDPIAESNGGAPSLSPTMPAAISGSDGAGLQYRFFQANGIDFLKTYPFRGDELVYCDPPYVRSSRSSPRDLYRFEMTDLQHRHLLRVIQELPCRVMLSGYFSRLYAEALAGWCHVTFQTMTRGGRPATEWLWFNFPEPVELHDYRYLGSNFRERERIKRKKQRWVARLQRMPLLERRALLSAIATIGRSGEAARSGSAL